MLWVEWRKPTASVEVCRRLLGELRRLGMKDPNIVVDAVRPELL